MNQTEILFAKIHSYDDTIATAMMTLKEGMATLPLEGTVERPLQGLCEALILQQPEVWQKTLRPLIVAVMTPLNAQAKFVQGLAEIMQYQQSNVQGNDELMFNYGIVIHPKDASLLYVLEFLNFTASMGKGVMDWVKGGEGLFFGLYFDLSYMCGFHVGIAARPLIQFGFLKDPSMLGLIEKGLEVRRVEREKKWHEMYPALAQDRPDANAEIAAFLSAIDVVSNKDANYKATCQEGWTAITAWAKNAYPAYKDVDAIPTIDLLTLFDQDASMNGSIAILNQFFTLQFAFARTCKALYLDLMADKRLPSIARILAIHAFAYVNVGGTSLVKVPEWWVMLAYGAPLTPCLRDIQFLLTTHSPLAIVRKTNFI